MYRRSSTLLSLSTIEYGSWLFCATHADSHDDRTCDLVSRCSLVDDATAIDDADDTANAQLCDAWIPFDLDKLRAEGVGGIVAGLGISSETAGFSVSIGTGKIRDTKNFLEGYTVGG